MKTESTSENQKNTVVVEGKLVSSSPLQVKRIPLKEPPSPCMDRGGRGGPPRRAMGTRKLEGGWKEARALKPPAQLVQLKEPLSHCASHPEREHTCEKNNELV